MTTPTPTPTPTPAITYEIHRAEHELRFVALLDGATIGHLLIRPREHTYGRTSTRHDAEITEVRVLPGHQRTGVGTGLVKLALSWAASVGFDAVAVESTADEDRPGPPFYAALGFTRRSIIWDIPLAQPAPDGDG
jgi:GNAT superfamily N-acetyltransferase